MTSALTPTLRAWRILVVDDEANVALTLQAGLRRLLGCEVAAATSGEAALQLICQQPFDLLITDYWMPGMNGITLVERAHRMYPGLLSVMLTADCSDELHDQAMHVPIQRILDKPMKLTELRSVIEALARNGTGTTGECGVPLAPARGEVMNMAWTIQDRGGRQSAAPQPAGDDLEQLLAAMMKAETEGERERLIDKLQEALDRIRTLRGLIPICSNCKKICDDQGYWQDVEVYVRDHSEADFTHGICPDCANKLYPEFYAKAD